MKLKHIPNILSFIRILLVFVFIFVFFLVDHYLALVIFLIAGLTDVIDGYLARKNQWITELGKVLDPLADKLMQCTVLICLCIEKMIPIWFAVPFFVKEGFTLLIGLIVIKRRDIAVVSKWYGKMTVCLFYATVAISIIFKSFLRANRGIAILIFIPAVISAIASLAAYIKHYAYLKNEEVRHGDILKNRKE